MRPALCPHCLQEVADRLPWPVTPSRCPRCRLIIGSARAIDVRGRVSSGAAAGIVVSAARQDEVEPIDQPLAIEALQQVAALGRRRVGRLRMLDYADHARSDPSLPSLAEIISTCGSWKQARRLADDLHA